MMGGLRNGAICTRLTGVLLNRYSKQEQHSHG
jgi:hypothetical protein